MTPKAPFGSRCSNLSNRAPRRPATSSAIRFSLCDEPQAMFRLNLLCFRRDTQGVAAMEAGLALPFIVAMAAGLFEFGSLFYNFEMMQTGVRDAARYLARVADPVASEAAARNLAIRGTVDTSGSPRVKLWQPTHIQIT